MDGDAIDEREGGGVFVEGEGEVGSAEDDGLGPFFVEEFRDGGIEAGTLGRGNDSGGGDAVVKARFHGGAGAENTEALEAAGGDGAANFRDDMEDGEGRVFFEGADAEMACDGGDDDAIGIGGGGVVRESGVDGDLGGDVIAAQVAEQSRGVGMDDGEVEAYVSGGEGGDDATVIESWWKIRMRLRLRDLRLGRASGGDHPKGCTFLLSRAHSPGSQSRTRSFASHSLSFCIIKHSFCVIMKG